MTLKGHAAFKHSTSGRREPSFARGRTNAFVENRDRLAELSLNAKLTASSSRPIDDRRMTRVMEFIDARLDRNTTVAELAAAASMSPAHFARSFKVTTGRTPHQFVSGKRLELASRMLADRHRPISDIALSTGFSSQSNFSRAFREAMGMTPGGYRAAQFGSRPAFI